MKKRKAKKWIVATVLLAAACGYVGNRVNREVSETTGIPEDAVATATAAGGAAAGEAAPLLIPPLRNAALAAHLHLVEPPPIRPSSHSKLLPTLSAGVTLVVMFWDQITGAADLPEVFDMSAHMAPYVLSDAEIAAILAEKP